MSTIAAVTADRSGGSSRACTRRALSAGETVSWDGGEARMTWPTRTVPIYLAASGPGTLRLAGRIADRWGAEIRFSCCQAVFVDQSA
jgi:hypothetical protein